VTLPSFTTYFDDAAGDPLPLPAAVAEAYGQLALVDEVLYANFVSTADGVAAIEQIQASSRLIGMGSPADRFLMGLLRACADVVVIGAGTFREHNGPWTAQQVFPSAADEWERLREDLGIPPYPVQVVVSRSGDVPDKVEGAVVVRSVDELVPHLRGRVLTEGGPHLMGELLQRDLVDELFLTIAPQLLGSSSTRPGLAAGTSLDDHRLALVSARREQSHLFLRYTRSRAA
jgi:riboflavin biosynthesis pyrimidine reductase